MARIERPILPFHLYRYRKLSGRPDAFEQEIDAIKNKYLWCANFLSMNDPMEGYYRPSSRLKGRIEKNKERYQRFIDHLYDQKSEIGICCFSDTKESELMWTHYADNYAGICVTYRAQRLVAGLPDDVSVVHLSYGDSPSRVSSKSVSDISTAARTVLSQKKGTWAYEREWRVLGKLGRVNIADQKCITRLYLGARISVDLKNRILRELDGMDIRIFEMQVVNYRHRWTKAARI